MTLTLSFRLEFDWRGLQGVPSFIPFFPSFSEVLTSAPHPTVQSLFLRQIINNDLSLPISFTADLSLPISFAASESPHNGL